MVKFKHKESGHTKELPDMYGKGFLLTSELARGYEIVASKKESSNEAIKVARGDENYKLLIDMASQKAITLEDLDNSYKVSKSIRTEIETLLA